MATYLVHCGDWGNAIVDGDTRSKAKYKAYVQWSDAYRPNMKNPFHFFLTSCIKSIRKI